MAIQYIGAGIGAAGSVALPVIPTHQAGDLILVFAFQDGINVAPSIPAGWINIINGASNSCGARVAYRIATSPGTTSSVWSSATSTIAVVYRGVNQTTPIGSSSQGGTATSTIVYPALTLQQTNGTSWVTSSAGHRATNVDIQNPPSGAVNRITASDTIDEAAWHDSNGGVTSWAGGSVLVGGTAGGWRAFAIELLEGAAEANNQNSTLFWAFP